MSESIDPIPFGSRRIGPGAPVLVIAEIGINHEGVVETCARMVEAAAHAGADAIKLQTVDADANYVGGTESHRVFSVASLTREETARMFSLARANGLEVFTTAGDPATLKWVNQLDPAAQKISSGLLTHLPLIREAARTGRPLLMSTGMAEPADIDAAVAAAREGGAEAIGLFQCTSLYPAPPETLDLAVIGWMEETYGVPAGFSDHSLGGEAAVLSVAAGARMIEKHFTLDPSRPGYDHQLSLDPQGFARMVDAVRAAERMMGDGRKTLTPDQADMARRMRRYLVAARDVAAGSVIGLEDIGVMRMPDGRVGLAPKHYDHLVGVRAIRELPRFAPFTEEFLPRETQIGERRTPPPAS